MTIKQKSTGYYLTHRGGFRKGLTAAERCATFHDPSVAALASVIPSGFQSVCRRLGLSTDNVELSPDNVF